MSKNKSSSFSSFYYAVTDLINASRIALAYCESTINASKMTEYRITDSSYFEYLLRVEKSEDGKFIADIKAWQREHSTDRYKFNYVLILGANDVIKALVSIPDVIDVSEWDTETVEIEFDYDVTYEDLEGDIGTLVSVHISDSIREEVHKGLLESGMALSGFDVRNQTNPHQFFRNNTITPVANDTIHYSGYICRYDGSTWNSIKSDKIETNILPIKILDGKKLVHLINGIYYINEVTVNDKVDNESIECISNDYIITSVDNDGTQLKKLYKFNTDSGLDIKFMSELKCQYYLNSVTNDISFYYDRTHYSRNFKIFELIDDLKSDRMLQTELDSIMYFTNVFYIKSTDMEYRLISYLHKDYGSISEYFQFDTFITDTLFIGHMTDDDGVVTYYLYEDTPDGLKMYVLGIKDRWYNIYLISKYRTNPYIPTDNIISYKGLVYYYKGGSLISI